MRLKAQEGYTMIVVLFATLIGTLVVAAAFTVALGDTGPARHDQYAKQAYATAEAGVNYYLAHLVQDSDFWNKCYTSTALPTPGPVNPPGTPFSSAVTKRVPGSDGVYEIELLKAPRSTDNCSASSSATVIDPATGRLSIRSTGSYRGVRRSIVATFARQGFLSYLWFTDKETPAPATTDDPDSTETSCDKYYRDGRGSSCGDQSFITGDAINGPAHTNDIWKVCGTPSFGRAGKNDAIEASDSDGVRITCGTPTWNGTKHWGAPVLDMPQTNGSLKNYASADGNGGTCNPQTTEACWVFTGPVHITLGNNGVTVIDSPDRYGRWPTTAIKDGTKFPPNGVIYVKNATCTVTFAAAQDYPRDDGCGDAWVKGVAGQDITIATENDIIVDGNVRNNGSTEIGMVANGFVRVYHPCTASNHSNGTNGTTSPEDPGVGYLTSPRIDAAILTLNQSFWVDNYDCGSPMGTLTVNGTIAQKFRGTVGTNDGGSISTGYLKNYNYDAGLQQHQPPYFLAPVQATWQISSETEQVPAH